MGRGFGRVLRVVGAAALVVAAMSAGSGWGGVPGVSVEVSPAVGKPGTSFVVSFRAPVRTGVVGSLRRWEQLAVASSSAGTSCLARASVAVRDSRRGEEMRVRLDPSRLGGRWCMGSYDGRLLELASPACVPATPCPTYVRLVGTLARFSLLVRSPGAAGVDLAPPTFAGIAAAFACTPGPQRPGQTTPYTLSWRPASDDLTPPSQIVYEVYYAATPGGEDFSHPNWTTPAGATSFRTPGLPSHGAAYFVVRARDAAGNQDGNTREQEGIDPCY